MKKLKRISTITLKHGRLNDLKQFDWNSFCDKNNNIAVHCKTEEEAKDFCKQMDLHGLKWGSGESYLKVNNYRWIQSETCYSNKGEYDEVKYYEDHYYRILEWSDYMQVSPKDILKPGYIVELRSGYYYICLPYTEGYAFIKAFVNPVNLKYYDNELNHKDNNDLDVMKIYGLAKYDVDILCYSSRERLLLWKRDERPEIKMTVEEMKQKLEEILNAKIVEE